MIRVERVDCQPFRQPFHGWIRWEVSISFDYSCRISLNIPRFQTFYKKNDKFN
jgi:hypothetical protein